MVLYLQSVCPTHNSCHFAELLLPSGGSTAKPTDSHQEAGFHWHSRSIKIKPSFCDLSKLRRPRQGMLLANRAFCLSWKAPSQREIKISFSPIAYFCPTLREKPTLPAKNYRAGASRASFILRHPHVHTRRFPAGP